MSKVHALSHEITNKPCTSPYYKSIVTTDLKNKLYNAEKRASDVEKMKNRHKQNFEGDANKVQLDKEDTRRSKLDGKGIFNILILLFIMFSKLTCKVRYEA